MPKVICIIVLALISGLLFSQGLENFDNFTYNLTPYVDGSFIGNNGITWNYLHVTGAIAGTNDYSIEGNGMILRRSAVPSKIFSGPIPNGIGNFSVQMRKAYTSAGERQVALYINDTFIANSQVFGATTGVDPTIHTFTVDGINIQGNFTLEIRHITGDSVNRQLTIDNISWTAYGSGNPTTATPTFTPGGGMYYNPVQVALACSTPSSTIYYTTDGSNPTTASAVYSTPIAISQQTTVKAMATAPGHEPSNIGTATYSFPVVIPNLTALRASAADNSTVYVLSGEIILTFKQTFRNQKYFQDAGAGILIDDIGGTITTQYNIYDGVTGLTGRLSEFGGMLQFIPTANSNPASSTNNVVTPIPITVNELITSFETYESRLVQLLNISFTGTGNFANGTVYPIEDDISSYNFRTTFFDVDYIGTPIPSIPKHIVGLPNSRVDGAYFSARYLADFSDPNAGVAAPTFNPPGGSYTQPINVSISCTTPGADIYYSTNGTDPTENSELYTNPITISATTTLKALAVVDDILSAISTAVYAYPASVPNIAALRSMPVGTTVYTLSGEAILTFKQTYRNQKVIQDATAGILIDDLSGVISTVYNIGDGITGIAGTLNTFGNMLQFTPTANPGAPTSTNNTITPVEVSVNQLISNFNQYQARYIRLNNMVFTTDEPLFANGTIYEMIQTSSQLTFPLRTTFYDIDLIGTVIPEYFGTVSGIATSTSSGNFISPRSLNDLEFYQIPPINYIEAGIIGNYNIELLWRYEDITPIPVGISGYKLYRNGNLITTINTNATTATFTDNVSISGTYTYYVVTLFADGFFESAPSIELEVLVSSNEDLVTVAQTRIRGNYPNPFNPSTTIHYDLAQSAPTLIEIYNAKGQLVKTLLNQTQAMGSHRISWNGLDEQGNSVSSGVYYFKLRSGKFSSSKKMVLMK